MKIQINIDIDITEDEVNFLRRYYIDDRNSSINIHLFGIRKDGIAKDQNQAYRVSKFLISKEVIMADYMGNAKLTQIGNRVCDLFDRDEKLKKLLNGD